MKHDSVFIWATAFDPEGKRVLAAGNGGSAWLWEVATGTRKVGPFRHLDAVFSAAFSPDGRYFATGCGDGTVCVWDPATVDKRTATFVHPQRCAILGVAFRDDGRRLLSVGGDGVARLWEPVGGRPLGGPCLHPKPLKCAAMDPRGRWILTGGDDGVARVWEAPTSVSLLPAMSRANWGIQALAFSPDGSTILTGNDVGDAMLWDATAGVAIRPPLTSPGPILSVAFSPDGRVFATAGRKQPLRIFDRQTGRPIRELAHAADLTALAFRPDDGTLLAGGEDGKARLWDLGHGRKIGPDLVHGAAIRSVAISPDSRLAVTAGDDGRAQIWKLGTNQPVSLLQHPAKVLDVAFTADRRVASDGLRGWKGQALGHRDVDACSASSSWDHPSMQWPRRPTGGPWRPAATIARSPSGTPSTVSSSTRNPNNSRGSCSTLRTVPTARRSRSAWATEPPRLRTWPIRSRVESTSCDSGARSPATRGSTTKETSCPSITRAWSEARRALAAIQSQSPPDR